MKKYEGNGTKIEVYKHYLYIERDIPDTQYFHEIRKGMMNCE